MMPSPCEYNSSPTAVTRPESFVYPAVSGAPRPDGTSTVGPTIERAWIEAAFGNDEPAKVPKYSEEHLREQLRAREGQVREQTQRETESRLREECETAVQRERRAVAEALREFEVERRGYFERLEAEVVQLALAIARKILQREAQVDPSALSVAVRAALERVAEGSTVQVRVPQSEVLTLRRALAECKTLRMQPDVVGDPTLPSGRYLIITDAGEAEVSFESQLSAIEDAFSDLGIRRQTTQATGAG